MSELLKQKKGRRYIPLKLKLAAVRSYVLQELSYSEVHQKYGVSSSTFARWLERINWKYFPWNTRKDYLCLYLNLFYR